jgi:colanic acid/amylovoran biosynthesis glycosyltransferase
MVIVNGQPDAATVAYVVSRFPSVTETFIVNEIVALEQLGERIQLFSLRRQDLATHSAPDHLVTRCTAGSDLGVAEILGAQLHWLRRRPRRWLAAWTGAIGGNWRSPRFLARSIATVPISMVFARHLHAHRIHAHWATHPALVAWVIHQLTDVPYSVTVHAHDLYVDRSMLHRKLVDAADIVTISDYNARMIADLYDDVTHKVEVIPCGVDTARLQCAHDHGTVRSPLRMTCVASLQDYKGHEHLLEACRILDGRGVLFHLELIGEGELRASLEASAVELGIDEYVTFAGACANADVIERVASSDVVVLPSVVTPSGKMEGVPVALMEAMALGTPVIASDLSGVSELIIDDETGLLVPPGNPTAIADAVERITTDHAMRRRLVCAGRHRVEDRYDLTRNAQRLAMVLTGSAA